VAHRGGGTKPAWNKEGGAVAALSDILHTTKTGHFAATRNY
jgi:hypothetical protein